MDERTDCRAGRHAGPWAESPLPPSFMKMLEPLHGTGVKDFRIRFALPVPVPLELTGKADGVEIDGVMKIHLWLIRDGNNTFLSTSWNVDDVEARVAHSITND